MLCRANACHIELTSFTSCWRLSYRSNIHCSDDTTVFISFQQSLYVSTNLWSFSGKANPRLTGDTRLISILNWTARSCQLRAASVGYNPTTPRTWKLKRSPYGLLSDTSTTIISTPLINYPRCEEEHADSCIVVVVARDEAQEQEEEERRSGADHVNWTECPMWLIN